MYDSIRTPYGTYNMVSAVIEACVLCGPPPETPQGKPAGLRSTPGIGAVAYHPTSARGAQLSANRVCGFKFAMRGLGSPGSLAMRARRLLGNWESVKAAAGGSAASRALPG